MSLGSYAPHSRTVTPHSSGNTNVMAKYAAGRLLGPLNRTFTASDAAISMQSMSTNTAVRI